MGNSTASDRIFNAAEASGMEDANGVLLDLRASSDVLVVSCSGIIPERIIYSMENTSTTIDTLKLFICDTRSLWYYEGIPGITSNFDQTVDLVGALVHRVRPRLVCAIGASAGGYMAIALAARLGFDRALAFGPQTTISANWRTVNHDGRWPANMARIHQGVGPEAAYDLRECIDGGSSCTDYHLIYSGGDALDRLHANRLRGCRNVHLLELPDAQHNISAELRARGRLFDVLNGFIHGAKGDLASEIPRLTR